MIKGLEIRKIIPFHVWVIPFPCSKINFKPLGSNEKYSEKQVFIRGQEVGEIIPFPVWIVPFPVSKTNF